MADAKIPGPLERRHLLEKELPPAQALAIAEAYLEQDRCVEAVDFLALAAAGARQGGRLESRPTRSEPQASEGGPLHGQGGRLESRPTRSEPQASEGGPLHGLAELRRRAIEQGDAFLLRAVAVAEERTPTRDDWQRLAEAADAHGLERYAVEARRQADRGND
jgi:hypothetical protein